MKSGCSGFARVAGRAKLALALSIVVVVLASCSRESNLSGSVVRGPLSPVIDPAKSIYGVPLGTSKVEFIRRCGPPTGEVRLKDSTSGLIYGSKHVFLFTNDRLSGIGVRDSVFNGQLFWLVEPSPFDQVSWRLSNGITNQMPLPDVKAILGTRLLQYGTSPAAWGFQYFREDGMRVDLEFIDCVWLPGEDRYQVHAVLVRPESAAKP